MLKRNIIVVAVVVGTIASAGAQQPDPLRTCNLVGAALKQKVEDELAAEIGLRAQLTLAQQEVANLKAKYEHAPPSLTYDGAGRVTGVLMPKPE